MKIKFHFIFISHEYDIFQKVIRLQYQFPDDFPEVVQDLIKKLVVTDPEARLGSKDYNDLKSHELFSSIDWTSDLTEQTPP